MPTLDNASEEELVRVGPGTPSGEVFRRYWLPVEASENVERGHAPRTHNGPKNPVRTKILGEELVAWRDVDEVAHVLGEHCSHRGTSLYYGMVEDHCLRCPYHGWAYDGEGRCVDQPAEPPNSRFKDSIRQTAYPTREVGGLIWAYMGPSGTEPAFPRYDALFSEDGLRLTGDGSYVQRCNVFQAMHDNNLDVWHPEVAHNWIRERPPGVQMHHGRDGRPATPISYEVTPWGTRVTALKDTDQPDVYEYYELHTIFPSARINRAALRFAVPIDDHNTRWFVVEFFPYGPDGELDDNARSMIANRPPVDLTKAHLPNDWVEQVGGWWNFDHPWRRGVLWEDEVICGTQGPGGHGALPDWSKWNLASSDRGVVLNRRVWREQIDKVRRGEDPIGVTRDQEDQRLISIPAARILTSWDDGMRLMEQSVQERVESVRQSAVPSGWLTVNSEQAREAKWVSGQPAPAEPA